MAWNPGPPTGGVPSVDILRFRLNQSEHASIRAALDERARQEAQGV